MAYVTFENVTKRYGTVPVIEGLDLEVRDEEFMVLVGPSGCGKSTALRMVAGLEEISGGTISIGARVVNDVPPRDRDIAMVFQNYALYPHMTVRENLGFGLKIRKTPRAEADKLVNEAADLLGISDLLDRKPKQLSGGQRQRVAVGRAIVRKPAVFLFDEPLSNLDAKLRVQMRAEITKLQQRLKTTTIYVTHDQVEAMTMGHRIAVMKDGRLQQVGTPLEVYDRPKNVFVATFIGTTPMNFVRATIVEGGAKLKTPSFEIPVPESRRSSIAGFDGRTVVVGIRPENVIESSEAGTMDPTRISGVIDVIETIGHEVNVHMKVGDEILVGSFDAHLNPKIGDKLSVGLDPRGLHLFDAATEARIGE
jgi:multiple sugar transport system ATP-binding protein